MVPKTDSMVTMRRLIKNNAISGILRKAKMVHRPAMKQDETRKRQILTYLAVFSRRVCASHKIEQEQS